MTKYIIIGNGVAGNMAAEAIRRHDPEGAIMMFSVEQYPFYYVPALPDFVAGERELPRLLIHNTSWYEQNRIDLHLKTAVTAVDPVRKIVTTGLGDEYPYDKLLLATGSYSFVPTIKGAGDTAGVFTLKNIADAEKIKACAQKSRQAVLIGGGLLGLEAGNGLRKGRLKVTVVEFFPRLLPRQMDVEGAAMLQRQLEEMGFSFHLGTTTREITRDADGLQVHLEAGPVLTADLVLISAGIRPELTLAKALGLTIDKGVKVDDRMHTGLDEIYAAGDLIEHRGRFYGIWPAAMEQGRVAGLAMAGQEAKYEGTVMSNTLKVVGIDLFSAGEIDVDHKLEAIVIKDEARKVYRKLVLQDNALVGAILLGDIHGNTEIQQAIKAKKDLAALKADLAAENFDFKRLQ
jgi:nitrite reductase (NADH) large subunit